MKRSLKWLTIAILFLFLTPFSLLAETGLPKEGKVGWVIDGDTFELTDQRRVRLIGVDAPEYQPWKGRGDFYGKEASRYLKGLLAGQRVRLESDIQPKDRYGRSLAYVYLEDGRFVNLLLVEEGYARSKLYPPNGRYHSLFNQAQAKAKSSKKGLWKNHRRVLHI